MWLTVVVVFRALLTRAVVAARAREWAILVAGLLLGVVVHALSVSSSLDAECVWPVVAVPIEGVGE